MSAYYVLIFLPQIPIGGYFVFFKCYAFISMKESYLFLFLSYGVFYMQAFMPVNKHSRKKMLSINIRRCSGKCFLNKAIKYRIAHKQTMLRHRLLAVQRN